VFQKRESYHRAKRWAYISLLLACDVNRLAIRWRHTKLLE
jgi:hypothetical protein